MSIPEYTQGFPPDGSSLGQTKVQIRDNLDGTFLTLGTDHINNNGLPGDYPAGYHNVIHIVTQSSLPPMVANALQVFSMAPVNSIPGTRAQLHVELNNGKLSQMTGNSQTENGNVWCAGMLIQWGIINGTHGPDNHFTPGDTITVSFNAVSNNFNFPTACLNIWTQPLCLSTNKPASSSTATVAIQSDTITTSGFSGTFTSGGSSYTSFFWIALGY